MDLNSDNKPKHLQIADDKVQSRIRSTIPVIFFGFVGRDRDFRDLSSSLTDTLGGGFFAETTGSSLDRDLYA